MLWYIAIKRELNDIVESAKKIKLSDLSDFNKRLQFIAEVCIFHSIAEDRVIFPAVDAEISFAQGHAKEEIQFNKLRCLIENIQSADANSSSSEFYAKLCSQGNQIMDSMQKRFHSEEVLPLARKHFSPQRQRELLYQSLSVMPLKLIECVLPWLVGSLSEEEAGSYLQTMYMAAPPSNSTLVTLFSSWACKGRSADICMSLAASGGCSARTLTRTQKDIDHSFCACTSIGSTEERPICIKADANRWPVKHGNLLPSED